MGAAYLLPLLAHGLVGEVLVAVLLVVPPVAAAARTLSARPGAWSYTSTWDSDEQMLIAARAHGGGTITVARLNTPGQIDNYE